VPLLSNSGSYKPRLFTIEISVGSDMEKTEELKVWMAGFFDGEGSALIEKTGPNSYSIVVAVSGTVEIVSEEIKSVWGGSYRSNRDFNTWSKTGRNNYKRDCTLYFRDVNDAYALLVNILPYLKIKADDAVIVMKALLVAKRYKDGAHRAKKYTHLLEPFYLELRSLREKSL